MAASHIPKDDKFAIIGATVLGISTALHLAARGYKDITIFDKKSLSDLTAPPTQDYPYSASRCSPADRPEHRDLSLEAINGWKAWNEELWAGKTVPPGLSPEHRVFINNGYYSHFGGDAIPEADIARVRLMEKKGMGLVLLLSTDLDHVGSANSRMFNFDPFGREEREKANIAVLDTLGGTVIVEKAYQFALYKAQTQGVKFVFGAEDGAVGELLYHEPRKDNRKHLKGVRTRNGKTHSVDFVVWACETGTSIPHLPSSLDRTATKTYEFAAAVRIPEGDELWDRFAPDNFPCWEHILRLPDEQGVVIFGFPREEDGRMIVGIRAMAESNIAKDDVAINRIKKFLAEFLPELNEAGVGIEPLSFNPPEVYADYCIIDRVPGVKNLLLAVDGRGTGERFIFLPNIGSHAVDVIEGGESTIASWKWKSATHQDKKGFGKAKL
ncbi:L-saccharopine oxidase [Cytospora mali]|uniref:L-saccharopine oxidase n=1 Tax=Cytospora mali TaxID=578113 RepID=A0A194W5M0_CYTMA|nr:L-saccharopine oxidase [Valsa mali]